MIKFLYFYPMKLPVEFYSSKSWVMVWIIILFAALLYSGTLSIIAMIMLLLPAIVSLRWNPFQIQLFPDFGHKLKAYFHNRVYFILTLFFWIPLFSIFNSQDLGTWSFYTMMKLPFLLLPFAFFHFPDMKRRDFHLLLSGFLLVMAFSTGPVLYNYLQNPGVMTDLIGQGQSMETPVDHIKYSLFLSMAIVCGIILLFENKKEYPVAWRWMIGIFTAYLFLFIHILAVRSGIVILYANLAIYFLLSLLRQKNYLAGALILVILAGIPVAAYLGVPTFREKIQYTIRDFTMSRQDKGVAFSDGERIRSYEVGWELFEESPVTGIGIGDIFNEYESLYEIKYFMDAPTRLPHNQFLTMGVSVGVTGLIFFLIAFIFPFCYRKALFRNSLLMALFVLFFLSFLVENTLERQYSVGFYLVFILLGLNQTYGNSRFKRLTAENQVIKSSEE